MPIDQITVDDQVSSWDRQEAVLTMQRIKAVHRAQDREVLRLDLEGEEICCTPAHRFFTGEWVAASQLSQGDLLFTREGGLVTVRSINPLPGTHEVFNLSVADTQNYFVGKQGVLVHNLKPVEVEAPRRPEAAPRRRRSTRRTG